MIGDVAKAIEKLVKLRPLDDAVDLLVGGIRVDGEDLGLGPRIEHNREVLEERYVVDKVLVGGRGEAELFEEVHKEAWFQEGVHCTEKGAERGGMKLCLSIKECQSCLYALFSK